MNHRLISTAALVLAVLPCLRAAVPESVDKSRRREAAGLNLQDGDRFIFIGDSITHQCLYTQYVENFYFTRFPERRIQFRNAGVSGDKAADVLERFKDDIARFKPTVATVLLGMNDGSYKDFDRAVFEIYQRDMTALLDKLDALGCRVFLMGPTMFDHRAWEVHTKKNPQFLKGRDVTGYNAVLGYYGGWLRETARLRGHGYVDLWGALNNRTEQGRREDPEFTLIKDAIHPDAPGQLVMAHTMLDMFGERRSVASVSASPGKNTWKVRSRTATLGAPEGIVGQTLAFDLMPRALPWVVGEEAAAGYKMTRAGHSLSQEAYAVSGFKPGQYELLMNGESVGVWDHAALARHVEIQEDPDSPTQRQAARVAELNKQRNDEAIRPLRDLYSQRKAKLREARAKNDMSLFDDWLPQFQKQQAALEEKAAVFEDQIYQANQPQKLRVEIKPVSQP